MTTNPTLWTTVTDELRERRERRAAARRLRADLATYRTPAEIEELLAMVEAQEAVQPVEGAAEIRDILQDNLAEYYAARRAPMRLTVGL